ncbi:MAG TPA: class IV adenylate cyclase [Terriglobales bacterium]|nr:class IV adenylate cyclase [Terriglobales bacterium]
MANEVEIKFVVHDLEAIRKRLRELNFREATPRTNEMNTLFDHGGEMRRRGEVLRIRKYGDKWTVTHKSKSKDARHKTRVETETKVADGEALEGIFRAMGFEPSFRYEKFRSEWSDGEGHVVLDETPIGNLGEIEGAPDWIDKVAGQLGLNEKDYITKSYAELFNDWTKKTGSKAQHMTFADVSH